MFANVPIFFNIQVVIPYAYLGFLTKTKFICHFPGQGYKKPLKLWNLQNLRSISNPWPVIPQLDMILVRNFRPLKDRALLISQASFFFSTIMSKQKKGKAAVPSHATLTGGPTINKVRRLTSLAS
jgi:hypothetical protein